MDETGKEWDGDGVANVSLVTRDEPRMRGRSCCGGRLCDVKSDALLDVAVGGLDGDGAVLVAKVGRLANVAEKSDFEDAGEELDSLEKVGRVLHLCFGERGVDAKVAIVGDDGTGLGLAHAEDGLDGTHLVEILQDLGVGKGSDLDGDTLQPLCAELGAVLAVVCDDDKLVCGLSEDLFAQMAGSTALDTVEGVVDFVSAVNGDVDGGEAVYVAKSEAGIDDELARLEAGGDEPALGIDGGTLLSDSFDHVGDRRSYV